jgi:hypothetical protein
MEELNDWENQKIIINDDEPNKNKNKKDNNKENNSISNNNSENDILIPHFDESNEINTSSNIHLNNNNNNENNFFSQIRSIKFNNTNQINLRRVFNVEKNYKRFTLCLIIGLIFLFFSIISLPISLFNPSRFISTFSLGSLIIIFSFIFHYGSQEYFSIIFSRERRKFTISYLCSLFIGFYFMMNPTYYLISFGCNLIQFIILIMFVLTFIPGGERGIEFFLNNFLLSYVKKFLNKK